MPRITVRVTTNASKSEVIGKELGIWKIRLAAPAVDGKANEALIRLLADEFDCAPSSVRIIKGQTAKMKIIEIL